MTPVTLNPTAIAWISMDITLSNLFFLVAPLMGAYSSPLSRYDARSRFNKSRKNRAIDTPAPSG